MYKKLRHNDSFPKKNKEKMRMSEKPVKLYIIRKVFMRGIQKMKVLSNLSNFFKSYGHLSDTLAFFYHKHSPNMVKSRDCWC